MKSKPDDILNQLVVAALTIFLLMITILAAVVLRHEWLQQRIVDLSGDVQVNLNDLEEITGEIQRELDELRTTPGDTQDSENWTEIAETLDDVDEQLITIEDSLDEVALALESPGDSLSSLVEAEGQEEFVQDGVDQVFTIFAVLVGIASIMIAILLAMAVRVSAQHTM